MGNEGYFRFLSFLYRSATAPCKDSCENQLRTYTYCHDMFLLFDFQFSLADFVVQWGKKSDPTASFNNGWCLDLSNLMVVELDGFL